MRIERALSQERPIISNVVIRRAVAADIWLIFMQRGGKDIMLAVNSATLKSYRKFWCAGADQFEQAFYRDEWRMIRARALHGV